MYDMDADTIRRQGDFKPRHYVARFQGGARFTLLGVMLAAEIEDRANAILQQRSHGKADQVYLRDLFPGGFVASSAGVFPAYAAAANHPDDPSKPRYTMREFVDLFQDSVPTFIPHKSDHMRKLVMQLGFAQFLEAYPWFAKHPVAFKAVAAPLRMLVGTAAGVMRASAATKEALKSIFSDVANPQGLLSSKLAFDRSASLQLLRDIVGEDTKLGDMSRNMIVTAQRLSSTGQIKNDYFVTFKDGEMKDGAELVCMTRDGQTPMIDVILGTTSVYGVFDPHNGEYIDGAPGMFATDIMADLRNNHVAGDHLGYVSFGNFDRSLIGQSVRGPLFNELRLQEKIVIHPIKQAADNTIRAIVGPEHSHFLEIPEKYRTRMGAEVQYTGSYSQMDSRPEPMDYLRRYGERWIDEHGDQLDHVATALVDAYQDRLIDAAQKQQPPVVRRLEVA
jgi:hypothetical protein